MGENSKEINTNEIKNYSEYSEFSDYSDYSENKKSPEELIFEAF